MKSERKLVKAGNGQKRRWEGVRLGQREEGDGKKGRIKKRVEPELQG